MENNCRYLYIAADSRKTLHVLLVYLIGNSWLNQYIRMKMQDREVIAPLVGAIDPAIYFDLINTAGYVLSGKTGA